MTLAAGARLGPYQIVGMVGAGGMGEVYRAHDTRLGRDVAIKVLSPHLAASPEVRARFEREARMISQLNHPHICTLFDMGREADTDYLVMEFLEGETLATHLAKGALPVAEVLKIGGEIADALSRAHRAGVIHRDLKPGNVMLTKSGAKLMDFGLARATALAGGPASGSSSTPLTQSPTIAQPLTTEGTIVGTFQYMAPEQVEGKEADARSDLWALGCVLYEMATGKRAFEGASQASLIAAILRETPRPISEIQPLTPPALDRVARQCLEKDPDDRWQSARDVASELLWISASSIESKPTASATGLSASAARPVRMRIDRLGWIVAALSILAAAAVAGASLWSQGRSVVKDASLHAVILHDGEGVIDPTPADLAISPDGRRIAYIVDEEGGQHLWVRDLESQTSRRLSDLVPVEFPFWSPDGRWVAFFTYAEPTRLWKIPAEGGAPVSLCAVPAGAGGTWGAKDVIVYAANLAGPLYSVPAAGGEPRPVTALDATRHQIGHRMPWFLPDGDHFLFVALPRVGTDVEIFAGSLGSTQVKRVMAAASGATYAEPGYLLFERDRKLVAQRFDASRLELSGEPVPLADPPLAVSGWDATWLATASRDGRLVSLRSWPRRTEVEWVDRSGRRLGQVPLPQGRWEQLALAPNGRSVLATRPVAALRSEVWLLDSERATAERVSPSESLSGDPRWAPDGRSFIYVSDASGRKEIFRQTTDRATAPQVIPTPESQMKMSLGFTPDGNSLLFGLLDPAAGIGLWIAPLRGGGAPTLLLPAISSDPSGVADVSPDGRWLAYVPEWSEIEVTSFPTIGERTRISTSGGQAPMWTRGGKELLFLAWQRPGSSVMSVPVESGASFTAGTPHPLFIRRGLVSFSATRDGERLLLSVESGETPPPHIGLTLNWTTALKGR